jgi:glycosyltransferase involved in cell wall biosynthesis
MKRRISIIIPAYNEARHLGDCLEAIARQTIAPFEVIVVDNNSTDETVAIAKRYPFVKVIHEPKQGIMYARTAGFNAARGNHLARIDADTRLPQSWVEQVQAFYDHSENAMASLTGGCRFYNLHAGRLVGYIHNGMIQHVNSWLIGGYFPWGSNSVIHRQCWLDVRDRQISRTDTHEDLDLGIMLLAKGHTTVYRPRLRVETAAKRIVFDHQLFWPYLLAWPRTLRVHQIRTWPLLLPVVVGVWLSSFGLLLLERLLGTAKGYPGQLSH